MSEIINLYRLFTREKVSSMRLLLYVILGLTFAGSLHITLFICDLIFVFGGILFASLLNDYFDFKLLGEANIIGKLISNGKVSEKKAFLLIWLPCILPFGLFFPMLQLGASPIAMTMLIVSFFLSLFYCAPPLRLKNKAFFGLVTPPIGIYLLFFQAVILLKIPGRITLIICALVFIFSWYLEFIHLADDAVRKNELTKISGGTAMEAAKAIGISAIIFSIVILPISSIGYVALFYWIIRMIVIWQKDPQDIKKLRSSLFSRIYCIEEFAVYAIWAIWLKYDFFK